MSRQGIGGEAAALASDVFLCVAAPPFRVGPGSYLSLMPVLEACDVHKTYTRGDREVAAVRGVTLSLEAGEHVALVGPSGCGKSTLLHLCGAMDRPSRGQVSVEGQSLTPLDDDQLTRLRRRRIGFVFQFFNLLPTLTVRQNIGLPLVLDGCPDADVAARTATVAESVRLTDRLEHYPAELSGGEAQRAAIARAVIHEPAVLIADEPTGNLDSENGARVLEVLLDLNRRFGTALLMATHNAGLASRSDRILRMRDGRETPES